MHVVTKLDNRLSCGTRTLIAKSCAKCLKLLMADSFPIRKADGYHDSWCTSCRNARTLKVNHETWDSANRSRCAWTQTDVDRVLELRLAGFDAGYIAKQMGRSRQAIYEIYRNNKD